MTTIGFIGLGIMGGPMAAHLVKAGFDVTGYNLTRPQVDALIDVGGRVPDAVAGLSKTIAGTPEPRFRSVAWPMEIPAISVMRLSIAAS